MHKQKPVNTFNTILLIKNGIGREIINEIYPRQEKYLVLRPNLAVKENQARSPARWRNKGSSCAASTKTSRGETSAK